MRSRIVVGLLLATALLAPPAARPAAPQAAPAQSAGAGVLLDVAYIAQTEQLCGGAAAAMVLRYWGDHAVVAQEFAPLVDSPAGGIHTRALTDAVEARGWMVLAVPRDASAIAAEIGQGRPVIALIEDRPGVFHYVVVVAVTESSTVLHDPARGPYRLLSRDDFDRRSAAADRWSLVVLPRAAAPSVGAAARGADDSAAAVGAVPRRAAEATGPASEATGPAATADAAGSAAASAGPAANAVPPEGAATGACDALVREAVRLARIGDEEAAERGLLVATAVCPASAAALAELAGLRFTQQRFEESARLASSATRLDPGNVYAWNLSASSHFLAGDTSSALQAWNAVGAPRLRDVRMPGDSRTYGPVLLRRSGLVPGEILTAGAFERARIRLHTLPAAASAAVSLRPSPEGTDVVLAVAERPVVPRWPFGWALVGLRSLFTGEVRLDVATPAHQGELWRPRWRWSPARPRFGIEFLTPAPAPLPGVLSFEGFVERQSYAGAGLSSPVREERRSARVSLHDWATSALFWRVAAAYERLADQRYGSVGGGAGVILLNDTLWTSVMSQSHISRSRRAGVLRWDAAWRSTPRTGRPAVLVLGGYQWASREAPLALWPAASSGTGRGVLFRGTPLVQHERISTPFLGRTLAFSTIEYRRPLVAPFGSQVSWAAFVDAARASERLNPAAGSIASWAVGLGARFDGPFVDGTLRIDAAYDPALSRWQWSAGYLMPWGARGMTLP